MISDLKSKVGISVNVRDVLYSLTLNQILGMIWEDALKVKASDIKGELLEVVDSMTELIAVPNISDFFPVLAPLDLQGVQRKMKTLSARYSDIVDSIMRGRVPSGKKAAANEGRAGDFIQLLLDLIDKKDPDMPLELIHARGIIFDLLSAGTGTTSSAVEWTMSELLRHPAIMEKVQAELDSVVGRGRDLEESHIPKLEYLNAVVKETLRLHPVLPLLAPHSPSATCEVGGYTIPKGAVVVVNFGVIHKDPSVWKEPLEFMPERFINRKKDLDLNFNGRSIDYCPFGTGRRICVGINLAERTMMHLLGSLLLAFEWRLPHGTTTVDVEDKYGTITRKKEPLVLVPAIKEIVSAD